ncbi:MAG: metallophosphoesterase [Candidatus Limivivens sp.]|nr:metallophosphoesterase [Candidatus Limivivens sp.]
MKKFVVRNYRIPIDRDRFPGCGPVTILLLSDLHGAFYGQDQELLTAEIRRQKPDLIIGAGDLVTLGDSAEAACTLIGRLAGDYPVYCANGNHESKMRECREERERYLAYQKELVRCGAKVLSNKKERLSVHGLPMEIAGLEIGLQHYRRIGAPKVTDGEMLRLLRRPSPQVYSLLIAHNPADFPVYAGWGADLVLSGHMHGGYIRLPLVGGVISPQMHPFPKYDRGQFQRGKSQMIVSAGIGDHDVCFRFLNSRELPVIKLM